MYNHMQHLTTWEPGSMTHMWNPNHPLLNPNIEHPLLKGPFIYLGRSIAPGPMDLHDSQLSEVFDHTKLTTHRNSIRMDDGTVHKFRSLVLDHAELGGLHEYN